MEPCLPGMPEEELLARDIRRVEGSTVSEAHKNRSMGK